MVDDEPFDGQECKKVSISVFPVGGNPKYLIRKDLGRGREGPAVSTYIANSYDSAAPYYAISVLSITRTKRVAPDCLSELAYAYSLSYADYPAYLVNPKYF